MDKGSLCSVVSFELYTQLCNLNVYGENGLFFCFCFFGSRLFYADIQVSKHSQTLSGNFHKRRPFLLSFTA